MRFYAGVEMDTFPVVHLYTEECAEASLCGYMGESLCSSRGEQTTICPKCLANVRVSVVPSPDVQEKLLAVAEAAEELRKENEDDGQDRHLHGQD